MKVISLGWGVQSFTLAAMAAVGELPPVFAAIHADTTHEAEATYAFARKWTPWLEQLGVRIVTVRYANPAPAIGKMVMVPAYAKVPGQRGGPINRQCTDRWKVRPIRQWLQAHRRPDPKKNKIPVEMWIGISLDEIARIKESSVKYITHKWPLVEMRMTRDDCKRWLVGHGLDIPPKSSCVFCPYKTTEDWAALSPNDLAIAASVDESIRKARPPYDLYLTFQFVPIGQIAQGEPEQLPLMDECTGACFL